MQTHRVDDGYLVSSVPTGPALLAALLRVSLRGSGVLEGTKETEEKLVKEDETAHRSVHSSAIFTSQNLNDDPHYLLFKGLFNLIVVLGRVLEIIAIKVCLSSQGIPGEAGKTGQDGKPVGVDESSGDKLKTSSFDFPRGV